MLSTAAPDFRPGSSLFGPVGRRSVTLVSGRLGGVRCGLSGPPRSKLPGLVRASICGRSGLHRGRPVDVHLSSDDIPVGGGQPTMMGVVVETAVASPGVV